ncbi:hypothetical protein BH11GEM1_BH11GEM1_34850 [soil metagenome]
MTHNAIILVPFVNALRSYRFVQMTGSHGVGGAPLRAR